LEIAGKRYKKRAFLDLRRVILTPKSCFSNDRNAKVKERLSFRLLDGSRSYESDWGDEKGALGPKSAFHEFISQ